MILTANRFLVVGGALESSSGPSIEVIDLVNPSLTCNFFWELYTRTSIVGGLLGNTPVVCGGTWVSRCDIFGQSPVLMTQGRSRAASVVINATTMWIMGGRWYDSYLSSTEFITLDNSESGPSFPHPMWDLCAVKFNESQIYVIGGEGNGQYSNEVYVYNPLDNFSYKYHSTMNYRRSNPGCAIMNDGDSMVIVVAGGYGRLSSSYSSNGELDSSEILDPSQGQWNIGKK